MKFAALLVFLALILTPVYPVYAVGDLNSSTSAMRGKTAIPQKQLNNALRQESTKTADLMLREKISTREALMKDRLARFKNQPRAQIAATVSNNLNRVNKNYTTAMLNHLNNLSQILVKLEARLVSVSSETDTTNATNSINSAKNSIADSSSKLNEQLTKDYTLPATSEAALKSEVLSMRMQLKDDLQANKELIMKTRQAVLEAIQAVNSVLGGKDGSK